jgi:hypothetical protein
VVVDLLGSSEERAGVSYCARHDAVDNQVYRRRLISRRANNATASRFEPDQTTSRSRNADRATSIGGMGERYDLSGNKGRRATR